MHKKRNRWSLFAQILISSLFMLPANAQNQEKSDFKPPAWVKDVGAKLAPIPSKTFNVVDFGADNRGKTSSTKAIQAAIDACYMAGGGTVFFDSGEYLTGSIFVKSNVHLRIDEGVNLLGSHDESEFPKTYTRAAGIRMYWHAAMINVLDQKNVRIDGKGTINGRGWYWWDKFWSQEKAYADRGLRWVVDYDIDRPHLIQIKNCENVLVDGLQLKYSQFWTVHVVFSDFITVRNVTIRNNKKGRRHGPSTDGVNIDSSRYCLVEGCDADTNDNNFSYKAGINADGIKVGIPVEYTVFRNCISRRGLGGFTLGSDASGGIHHVAVYNNKCIGTDNGIRFKSAKIRGTITSDVHIHNIEMENVGDVFEWNMNWFPAFSYPKIPDNIENVPDFWKIIAEKVPAEKGLPHFRDIHISNVTGNGKRLFFVQAYPEVPIENVTLKNINVVGERMGFIKNMKNWTISNTRLTKHNGETFEIKGTEHYPTYVDELKFSHSKFFTNPN